LACKYSFPIVKLNILHHLPTDVDMERNMEHVAETENIKVDVNQRVAVTNCSPCDAI